MTTNSEQVGAPSRPRFHHVGLTVSDLDRSYAFYCTVAGMSHWDQDVELGLKPAPEHRTALTADGVATITTASDAFRTLTENPKAVIRYAMLRSADGALVLQLVQYLEGGGPSLSPEHCRVGSAHLSFFVPDVDAAREAALRHSAATVRSAIIQINPSMRTFYVDDPDGIPVEFLEVAGL